MEKYIPIIYRRGRFYHRSFKSSIYNLGSSNEPSKGEGFMRRFILNTFLTILFWEVLKWFPKFLNLIAK